MNITTIGVLGAGQMGAGIAEVCAAAGYATRLADVSVDRVEAAKAAIAKRHARAIDKGKLSAEDSAATLGRIVAVAGPADFADCQLVIEAATENEGLKRELIAKVGAAVASDAIIATNTSSISITRLAQAAPDASRFVGVHFFNPVPVMGLVELIRGMATAPEVLTAMEAFAARLGKAVVHASDAPGFIVNRVLMPMINEAATALGEGVASIADIDTACRLGLNHPMGPLTLADFIGLDTCLAIIRVLQDGTGDPRFRPAAQLIRRVDAGWLGKKSGRGFYDWTGAEPVPV